MVCSKCGAENPDDANFCIGCGTRFVSRSEVSSNIYDFKYAGFWERFLAYCIDSIVLAIGSVVVGFVGAFFIDFIMAFMGLEIEEMEGFFVVLFYIFAFILSWLYYTIMESSKLQATLGKKICDLVVTDSSGKEIRFGRANARFWSKFISGAIFGVGYIMAAFTEKHQALHDMMADTLVLKKK